MLSRELVSITTLYYPNYIGLNQKLHTGNYTDFRFLLTLLVIQRSFLAEAYKASLSIIIRAFYYKVYRLLNNPTVREKGQVGS